MPRRDDFIAEYEAAMKMERLMPPARLATASIMTGLLLRLRHPWAL